MLITWNTNVNAPCCPGEIVAEDGRTLLIQTDWDYPGTAATFGWSTREVQQSLSRPCGHYGTDGTIDCEECHISAGLFIENAGHWLRDHNGATAEDPGYFD